LGLRGYVQNGVSKIAARVVMGILAALVLATAAIRMTSDFKVPPPKPYEMAMYDVYSDLLQAQRSWWDRLIDPRSEAVLIRTETEPGQDHQVRGLAFVEASLVPEQRFKQAVDSAIADYAKRNSGVLELRRKFSLPTYDLISDAEEEAVLQKRDPTPRDSACRAFQEKYHGYDRWVELSAVGFNEDQSVAVVYMVEWRGRGPLCSGGIFGHGGYRMLHKQDGKWHLLKNQEFSDWIT
jgi:hypothetical protein